MQRIFRTYEQRILNVYVWLDQVLCWSLDSTKQEWNINHSIKVHQGDTQEVWYGRFKTIWYSHVYWIEAYQR